MAENKRKIIVYSDWIGIFEKLEDDEAGRLVKHFFRYINDLNPKAPDRITDIAFEPIMQTLKRDLKKWESFIEKQRENGKSGGRPLKDITQKTQAFFDKPKKADSVIDNVNDSVIDNVNKYKNTLLSEIKISDFPELNKKYFEITIAFYELFKKNLSEAGAKLKNIEKAKGIWIDEIRLIIEVDKYTVEDLQQVYLFLQVDSFWKKNILSTAKLRKQMDKLKLAINNGTKKNKGNNETRDFNELAGIIAKHSEGLR